MCLGGNDGENKGKTVSVKEMKKGKSAAAGNDGERKASADMGKTTIASASDNFPKKRIWGQSNPFDFPPSQYHKGLLRAVEPFIVHHRPGVLPEFNKFKGSKMRRDTITAAARILLSHFVSMESVLSEEGKSEGNIRPLHMALLQGFKHLTTPSEEMLAKHALRKKYASMDENEEKAEITPEDHVSGLSIKVTDQQCIGAIDGLGSGVGHFGMYGHRILT